MTTSTLSNKLFSEGGRHLLDLIDHLKRRRGALTGNKTACEDLAEIELAYRTLQLAGNPGEDYDVVAARIDQEAARYKAFLQKPEPIGKIVLNVKQLKTREQYQVTDPAEGRASVCYRFSRSNSTVLEFLVYDEKDNPLFPIARTYTNWVGAKEFTLGLNRTFYLDMFEDDPGYVKVYAGFAPVLCEGKSPTRSSRPVAYFPPQLERNKGWSRRLLSLFWPFPARLAYVIGVEAVLVSVVCSIFWTAMGSLRATNRPSDAQILVGSAELFGATGEGIQRLPTSTKSTPVATERKASSKTISSLTRSRSGAGSNAERALDTARLHGVQTVSVSVDNSLCEDAADCRQLWSNVQHAVQSRIDALSSDTLASDQAHENDAVKLFVSYKPIDWKHGHVAFTLYDNDEALLSGSHEFDCAGKRLPVLVDAFCSEISGQILAEMTNWNSSQSSGEQTTYQQGSDTK